MSTRVSRNAHSRTRPPLALVTGGTQLSYGIVRALGEGNVDSVVASYAAQPAAHSRYARHCLLLPDMTPASRTCRTLLEFAGTLDQPPVIFPHSEQWIQAIADDLRRFAEAVRLPWPGKTDLHLALSKLHMDQWCRAHGFRTPRTLTFRPGDDFGDFVDELRPMLPVVLKPETKQRDDLGFDLNPRHCGDEADLAAWAGTYPPGGPSFNLIAQSYVPGGVEQLVAYHGYKSADGRLWMAGLRKIRTIPPFCGSCTTAAYIRGDADSARLAEDLMRALPYAGLFDIEFKYHREHRAWYFIELNPRCGLPNYAAKAVGVNLPLLAYNEAVGRPLPEPRIIVRSPLAWSDFGSDLKAARAMTPSLAHALWLRHRTLRRHRLVRTYANRGDPGVMLARIQHRLLSLTLHCRPALWVRGLIRRPQQAAAPPAERQDKRSVSKTRT